MTKKVFLDNLYGDIARAKNRQEVRLIILANKNLISELCENKELSLFDCMECLDVISLLALVNIKV